MDNATLRAYKNSSRIRARVEDLIREFFDTEDFARVRTPSLVPCPGMEPHIRPFEAVASGITSNTRLFLHTSPEFAMKKLLVAGMQKIYQLCTVYRSEPPSSTHRPEFTMLEWYRANEGYEKIMEDAGRLLAFIARKLTGGETIPYQGRSVRLTPPWPRLRTQDLFRDVAKIDLLKADLHSECERLKLSPNETDTWDDLYFRIWLNVIEPALPQDRAAIVYHYPPSQAALSVIETLEDGSRWARRFEIYAGGLELGNAFEELTDPSEQRRRFEEDLRLRAHLYGPSFPASPMPEDFLDALGRGMPPSGGIAIGVDRLAMLFADTADIGAFDPP
ncbi:MAG: EF-P lysine aminoacylase GenX [Bdellovibrionales bacterium RIFOXYD1_FULL_53_11]|nr:MAG: EF-P lysine aminoacylase GenX [Bdellovibrionales bacterium RIFOXYD1_FULL_53_11]